MRSPDPRLPRLRRRSAGAIRYGRRQKAARQYRHPAVVLDDLLDRVDG
ncbi:MAG: hypothetical protein GX571_00855 [Lentisphaerae bacterium]|nr:hypothetical protein [Lentisphaerota bacterium]